MATLNEDRPEPCEVIRNKGARRKEVNATLTGWIAANGDKFDTTDLLMIKQKLENASEDKAIILHSVKLKDPTTGFWMCFFLGWLGIHWFWLGEGGKGVIRLILGCLWFFDWFSIKKAVRKYNYSQLLPYL